MTHRLLVLSVVSLVMGGAIALGGTHRASANPLILAQTSSERPQNELRGQRPRIDFAAAAAQLGTTEAELKEALGVPARPEMGANGNQGDRPARPNLQTAASQLGVSEEQLRQALGITIDPATGRPAGRPARPDLQSAATQLGVSETALREALGRPEGMSPNGSNRQNQGGRAGRPRLDIAGAAARLGVTEQQVIDALGIPPRPQGDRNQGQ